MKILGIIFLVLSVLNLIVGFVALANNAPSQAVTMKFNGFVMLAIIGGLLYYFGNKKKKGK